MCPLKLMWFRNSCCEAGKYRAVLGEESLAIFIPSPSGAPETSSSKSQGSKEDNLASSLQLDCRISQFTIWHHLPWEAWDRGWVAKSGASVRMKVVIYSDYKKHFLNTLRSSQLNRVKQASPGSYISPHHLGSIVCTGMRGRVVEST